jgi:beta-mannosidase
MRVLVAGCIVGLICVASAKPSIRTALIEPSDEFGTMPDKAYVTDYYAPPVDAVPQEEIGRYTLNTRVPEYHWLKYDGAYALALRLKPIDCAKIEKVIAVGLVNTNINKAALTFNLAAEKQAASRTVVIDRLDLDACAFTGMVYKVKAKARNAGDRLSVTVRGKEFSALTSAEGKPAKEGFVEYAVSFKAKPGARIDRIAFELPAATATDFEQEFDIIDLRLHLDLRREAYLVAADGKGSEAGCEADSRLGDRPAGNQERVVPGSKERKGQAEMMAVLMAAVVALNGTWTLEQGGRSGIPAEIPGDNYSALLAAKLIPDPFVGTNEWTVQAFAHEDAVFSRSFDCPAEVLAAKGVRLEFDSVDPAAVITLNGRTFSADNQFRRWSFDVTGLLRSKGNVLSVLIKSPVRESLRRQQEENRDPELASFGLGTMKYINFLRKAQCQAGWDWGVSLPASGILGDVRLRTAETAYLEHVWTEQMHADGKVKVTVVAELMPTESAKAGDETSVTLMFDGRKQTVMARVPRSCGVFRASADFAVANPKLWWPNGFGEQPLYPFSAACEGNEISKRTGLRTVEVVREKDAFGESFKFRVNDVDVFAKGWNWIPSEAFPSRRTASRARRQLEDAALAHANMIRVWGGGVYEPDAFYDACDELGLMVWQDMMFACGYYPVDRYPFRDNVKAEVTHQISRLRSHPSIALWCGDNETYWCSWQTRTWYALCDRLTTATMEAAARAGDDRLFWPSSPCSGDRRWEENHDPTKGDSHFWGVDVLHDRKAEGYFGLYARFLTEYGWGSFPRADYLARFVSTLDPKSAEIQNHCKKPGALEQADKAVRGYIGEPKDAASLCYLTQALQAHVLRKVQNHFHATRPRCMGVLDWQLNDWWPVYGWSSIDHGLNWKPAMYAARRFNAPLVVCLNGPDSETGGIRTVIWDLPRAAKGELVVTRRKMADGSIVFVERHSIDLPGAGVQTFGKAEPEDPSVFLMLRAELAAADGRNFVAEETELVSRLAQTTLPDPHAKLTDVTRRDDGSYAFTVSVDAPAFGATPVVLGDFGGRFDKGYETLLPGRHVFTYRPGGNLDTTAARQNFRLYHLQGERK